MAKRKQSTLNRDLLLGFKPVELFVESIEQRYGNVTTVCADFLGGSLIGIKWRSSVSFKHLNEHLVSQHPVSPTIQASHCAAGQLWKLLGQQHHDARLQELECTQRVVHMINYLNSGLAWVQTFQPTPAMS